MSDLLEQAVVEYWGERCPDFDPGCLGCLAWKMVDELAEIRAENASLRTRLEIDPSHPYDGIYARDETIRGLEKQIESLRQKTQYWPDNAERDAVIRHQKEVIERLREALLSLGAQAGDIRVMMEPR